MPPCKAPRSYPLSLVSIVPIGCHSNSARRRRKRLAGFLGSERAWHGSQLSGAASERRDSIVAFASQNGAPGDSLNFGFDKAQIRAAVRASLDVKANACYA
jgi:hypothetical protein